MSENSVGTQSLENLVSEVGRIRARRATFATGLVAGVVVVIGIAISALYVQVNERLSSLGQIAKEKEQLELALASLRSEQNAFQDKLLTFYEASTANHL